MGGDRSQAGRSSASAARQSSPDSQGPVPLSLRWVSTSMKRSTCESRSLKWSRIATNLRCCSCTGECLPGPRSQSSEAVHLVAQSRAALVEEALDAPVRAVRESGSEHHGLGQDEGPVLVQPGQQRLRLLIDEARGPLRADLPLAAHSNSNPPESALSSPAVLAALPFPPTLPLRAAPPLPPAPPFPPAPPLPDPSPPPGSQGAASTPPG